MTSKELKETNRKIFGTIPQVIGIKQIELIGKYLDSFNWDLINKLYKGLDIWTDKGCWSHEDGSRYYQLKFDGRYYQAHRLSLELFDKNFNPNLLVCHHCDRPGCRNPFHLFNGTAKQNYRDAIDKKRIPAGRHYSRAERQYINGIHWTNLKRFAGE